MLPVLCVEPENRSYRVLEAALSAQVQLTRAFSAAEAFVRVARERPRVIITELRLGDCDGVDFVQRLASGVHVVPIVVASAFCDSHTIVRAVRAGAMDYICKPLDVPDLRITVARALQQPGPDTDGAASDVSDSSDPFVGRSPGADYVRDRLARFADTEASVLIQGESGVGKDLVARSLHRRSRRAGASYVARNCAAIPETLFETEMFGVRRGAYTDAISRTGCFEAAHGGTLFLDEITEMPQVNQVKLLRAVEEQRIARVGEARGTDVDVRLLAASNRELGEAVQRGAFRHDLYYRLNVLPLTIPPLRERPEDIPLLVEHFLQRLGSCRAVRGDAMTRLTEHLWPGNVRELRNVVHRAALLADGGAIDSRHITFL